MSQNFQAGDFLIFQIESAYGLLRLLAIDETDQGTVWHLAAYNEMFLDIETADAAIENDSSLTISYPHLALTNRAFESTQVTRGVFRNTRRHEVFQIWLIEQFSGLRRLKGFCILLIFLTARRRFSFIKILF